MRLMMDIPDKIYETVQNGTYCGTLYEELKNGIPLSESEDCVSRQDACSSLICRGIDCKDCPFNNVFPDDTTTCLMAERIKELPPVTPAEKVGHWIELDNCSNSGYYCSKCQKKVVKEGWSDTVKKIKYCPNCGCRMMQEVQDADSN